MLVLVVFTAVAIISPPAIAADSLASAQPGDLVQLPDRPLKEILALDVPIKSIAGPALLFSDGPEYFPSDGIGLREDVEPGKFRLYVYHCPESTGAKKTISSIIENRSDKPMKVSILRYSFQKPGKDYLKIGKAALIDFFNARHGPPPRVVAPHGRMVLDPAMDRTVVVKDDLVHAFDEIEVDQPARVYVFQRDPGKASLEVLDKLPLLERGPHGAGRGKFAKANFSVDAAYDTHDGPRQVIVADGKRDPWITGEDSIAGHEQIDKGNYGAIYHMRFTLRSSDNRAVAMLMINPHEGKNRFCTITAAAVKLTLGDRSKVIPLPREQVRFHQYPQAVVIGVFDPPAEGKSRTVELTYSPPGASCLPTPILLIPLAPK